MNQALHRWTKNLAWVFFFVGFIVVPIWETHKKNLPRVSDLLIGCFLIVCAVGSLIALVKLMVATIPGDWKLFAKSYPPQTRPAGNAYRNLRSHGQRVIFTGDGLYFYKVFLARPGHPPFLLPWKSVKRVRKCRGLFQNYYMVEIKDAAAKLRLELPETVAQELSKFQKDSLIHK